MRDFFDLLDRAGQRSPAVTSPLSRPCPSNYADAQMWLRYALALQEGAPWQVRHTDLDNAPDGREVHWDSGFAHALALAGRVEHARTGAPLPQATEQALLWFDVPLLLGAMAVFSVWTARRWGAAAGALVAVGMIGFDDLYSGFMPNYADHHGLLSAAVFGMMLGALGMGGGWWRAGGESLLPASKHDARRAVTFSAVCGALGMWVSAATVIPAIGIIGVAAVVAAWLGGGAARRDGAEYEPDLWRWWGRLGASLSVIFYLLEYAPSHLGVRLEVNHPFHALAWWGGAELVALLAGWRISAGAFPWRRLALPMLALSVSPLAIATLGSRAFIANDPFVAQLSDSVAEGITLWKSVTVFGWGVFLMHVNLQLVPLGFAAWQLFRVARADRLLLGFASVAVALFVAMGCWKLRWWANAGGPLLALLLVALAAWFRGQPPRLRWTAVGLILGLTFLPSPLLRVWRIHHAVSHHIAGNDDLIQPIYRDIAAALRASQPQGDITLLASPNASVGIGYYGRFKTIGTLYWENTAGLRAAAEIFCTLSDDEALRLIRARGITHLAMVSQENYLSEYFSLLRPHAPADEFSKTFGARLLFQRNLPVWLRPLPYRPPAGVTIPGLSVMLLQVMPNQTVPEALWHLAVAQLSYGELAGAEKTFERALLELPVASRGDQCFAAANLCYQNGAHAAALRFYRALVAEHDNEIVLRCIAWVLATSPDDKVRDGREALALVARVAALNPNKDAFADVQAAALAENGRFAEAVEAASRSLALARTSGDRTFVVLSEQRLTSYQHGRPWRQ
jgi:tetratricopeptide (TPR) repeat protein